jgi:hypothetical protein
MTIRRQKKIADTLDALERALDQREALLGKLVRCELKIRTLRKRSTRAQKAYVKGDASVAAGVAPSPYRADRATTDELNDEIPL